MCVCVLLQLSEGEWGKKKKIKQNEAPKKSFDFDSCFCVFVRFHWQISKDTVSFFVLRRKYATFKIRRIQKGANIRLNLKK